MKKIGGRTSTFYMREGNNLMRESIKGAARDNVFLFVILALGVGLLVIGITPPYIEPTTLLGAAFIIAAGVGIYMMLATRQVAKNLHERFNEMNGILTSHTNILNSHTDILNSHTGILKEIASSQKEIASSQKDMASVLHRIERDLVSSQKEIVSSQKETATTLKSIEQSITSSQKETATTLKSIERILAEKS